MGAKSMQYNFNGTESNIVAVSVSKNCVRRGCNASWAFLQCVFSQKLFKLYLMQYCRRLSFQKLCLERRRGMQRWCDGNCWGIRGENPRILSASQIMFKTRGKYLPCCSPMFDIVWKQFEKRGNIENILNRRKLTVVVFTWAWESQCGRYRAGLSAENTLQSLQLRIEDTGSGILLKIHWRYRASCWKYMANRPIENWHFSTPRIALFLRPLVGEVLYPI